jgi:hypothetical protein
VCSQGNSLVSITNASTLASGKNLTFASSGSDITQIFGSASTPVAFTARSALTHHGNAVQRKSTQRSGRAITNTSAGNLVVTLESNEASQTATQAIPTGFSTRLVANNPANVSGHYLGMTVSGLLAGFTLTNMTIEYIETNVGNQS